eukprot:TRINITY_DN1_c0_g1_i2.p1 TRINITY_DN1_c0_g1~~TRINITY_DN1_c0_g1_i2.p1  ORF type:complete len:1008 (-),score=217.13 TRINITY_DN1_c0_g1_i2:197-3220(-)
MGPMPRLCGDDELRSVIQALGPEEALGNFKLPELKAMCKRFNLKSTGDKHQLIGFIASHILAANADRNGTSSKAQKRTLEISEADPEATKRPCTDLAKHLKGIVQALGPEEALGNLTVPELKDHCRRFGLKPTGDKRSIIFRIATHVLALDLAAGVQTDSASAPTQDDQLLHSTALGNKIGEAASSPEATMDRVSAAARSVTCNHGLDVACVAAESPSVARSEPEIDRGKHVMDVEPATPLKRVSPKGEMPQLLKCQALVQEAAIAEADALAADTSPTACEEREATMAAAWKQAVLCQDDTGNQGVAPCACDETTKSVAPADPMQVDGGTGGNINAASSSGMQTTHEQHPHSDISGLAGHPGVCEGTTEQTVVDLEKSRSVESEVAMIPAAPTVPTEVERESRTNIDLGSLPGVKSMHEHSVHSSSADSVDHPCVRKETIAGDSDKSCVAESGAVMIPAFVASAIQGPYLADLPHVCEGVEEIHVQVAVDSENLCPAESEAASIARHINEICESSEIQPPSGMQAMHEHQEHSGSADTLLEEDEEKDGEDVYEEQQEQDAQQLDGDDELNTSLADVIADQSSMAFEQEDATRATAQALATDGTAHDNAGKPSVSEDIADTFIVQPEQVPSAASQVTSLPSAQTAFIEDNEETGEKCKPSSIKMLLTGLNSNQENPESAETQVDNDRDEWQDEVKTQTTGFNTNQEHPESAETQVEGDQDEWKDDVKMHMTGFDTNQDHPESAEPQVEDVKMQMAGFDTNLEHPESAETQVEDDRDEWNDDVKMQMTPYNTSQEHAESAETQVEDDRDECQDVREVLHSSLEVEEGDGDQQEERQDKQREEREEEPWEEQRNTLVEKAKGDEALEGQSEQLQEIEKEMREPEAGEKELRKRKRESLQDEEEKEEECEMQDRLQSLVCSRHGTRGGWTINEYCSECDAIAVSAMQTEQQIDGNDELQEKGPARVVERAQDDVAEEEQPVTEGQSEQQKENDEAICEEPQEPGTCTEDTP